MTTPAIYRYEVPVDDQWHGHDLGGDILHVDARNPYIVEFWALHGGGSTVRRVFRAFGTGQPLPDDHGRHIGTAVTAGGALVWHLMERA
jgi:hypothetical protein